jgi:ubiquinone biosynthesis protein
MTDRERMQKVRNQLAARGLLVDSRRRRSKAYQFEPHENPMPRLAQTLEELGPLFATFGRYLGSRVDWLPLADCRQLGTIDVATGVTPLNRVGPMLAADLPAPVDEVFSDFEEIPLRATFLHQWHRALLAEGGQVIVKLLRPDSLEQVYAELPTLPVLEELWYDSLSVIGGDLTELMEQFVVWLDRQLDLRREREALAELAEEVNHFGALVVPEIHHDLCSHRVLVVEELDSVPLDSLVAESARYGRDRGELARRLCMAWFQKSLLGSFCLEGPLVVNLSVLDDDRFSVMGGLLVELDALWRRNILDAVAAGARDDPDRACECLVRECLEDPEDDERDELRKHFRQADPFRSGGWAERPTGLHLADTIFVQWRLLRRHGLKPKPHLLSFMRGFAELELISSVLAPERDVVAEAIDDLRVISAAVEIREQLGPIRLARQIEQYIPVVRELVPKADEIARELRQGRVRLRLERKPKGNEEAENKAGWPVFGGALLMFAAIALIGSAVVRAHPESTWIEPVAATLFLVVSAALIWIVGKTTRG